MRRSLAGLLALVAVAGGCSSDDGPAPAAGGDRLDACSIYRPDDFARIDHELVRREPDAAAPAARCFYVLSAGTQLNLTVEHDQGRSFFGAAGPGSAVAGVADEAKWVGVSQLLAARRGTDYVAVAVISTAPEAERRRDAATMARVALSRMR